MKKILMVGDDYIGSDYMKNGFAPWQEQGYELVESNWLHGGMEKMSEMNRIIERDGPDAVPVHDEAFDLIKDAEMLIVEFMPVPQKLIDAAPALKYIGTLRTGLENIDIQYASSKGIDVFNTPGRLAETVSDYTIAFMIGEARNMCRGHAALKQGDWRRDYHNNDYVPELRGHTVGLVGFGHIARAVARKLSGFKTRTIASDPYVSDEQAKELGVELVDLETLMKESDFVSVHTSLTESTHHLIGKKELALMKPTAIIVNTARGNIIDEEALIAALQEKRIGGAALDVFANEPPGIDHPLVKLDNCTVTPHLAGTSVDCMINCPKMLANAMLSDIVEGKESGFRVGG
jgi:D-3-phosphoglycerate dehydrogenase